jgi:putative ABC transport system ATP-binding protein
MNQRVSPVLKTTQVCLNKKARRTDGEDTSCEVLTDLSVAIPHNTIFAVVGPSGSGKSSLLRLFNRLEEPSKGTVYFQDEPITSFPVTTLRRRIGWVPQVPVMFAGTVEDNILYGRSIAKVRDEAERHSGTPDAGSYLSMVGLSAELASRSATALSIGEKQRVALARCLANNSEVLLLDEPTAALDPSSRSVIENLIVSLKDRLSLSVVLVTHDLEQARRLAEWGGILYRGRIIESGKGDDIFFTPREGISIKFIEGSLTDGD